MSDRTSNATQDITVDGTPFDRIERPQSVDQLSDVLSDSSGQSFIPFGGGTLLSLGNIPEGPVTGIDTRGIDRVLSFEPADLTLSVEAGVTLAQINAELGERGQWLPIDSPFPERSTIGGLIAAGFSGPRRLGSETIRDLLVGISVVLADGTVTKAGGMVVKNVTGFDMMRLYHGSLGTLGVIASANFKVFPRPRTERTVLVTFTDLHEAMSGARAVLASRAQPVALEVISRDGAASWTVAVRLQGRPGTVDVMTGDVRAALAGPDHEAFDGADSAAWWQRQLDLWHTGSPIRTRQTCRPRLVEGLARAALANFEIFPPRAVAISPGLGRIDLELDLELATDSRDELFAALYQGAENVQVLSGPPAFKQGTDVWGRTPEGIDVMRRLKQEFDPERRLNRGRFTQFI